MMKTVFCTTHKGSENIPRPLLKWVGGLFFCIFLLTACGGGGSDGSGGTTSATTTFQWNLPKGFPEPKDDQINPTTEAKIQLGRHLFYDTRLSGNGSFACASCHQQGKAFSDGLARAVGSTGMLHPRNSQSLANVVYFPTLTWASPVLTRLEQQMEVPLFGDNPVEMGLNDQNKETVLNLIRSDTFYQTAFQKAFANETPNISWKTIIQAIASFERTLISGDSTYDQYLQGKIQLTASQERGMNLFMGKAECFHCHGSEFLLTDQVVYKGLTTVPIVFHNTGLFNIGGTGAFPEPNRGLFEHTQQASDMGKFRAPSLRNVEVTAPYMHDGSMATLEEVVDFYSEAGRNITSGPYAGDGRLNPYKDPDIQPLNLNTQEKADLVAFLKTLTDHGFLTNPAFAKP
jgi:cytochrome c peroxidase